VLEIWLLLVSAKALFRNALVLSAITISATLATAKTTDALTIAQTTDAHAIAKTTGALTTIALSTITRSLLACLSK